MQRVRAIHGPWWKTALHCAALTLPALLLLEGTRLAWNISPNLPQILGSWAFIAIVLLVARAGRVVHGPTSSPVWPWPAVLMIGLGLSTMAISIAWQSTWASWVWLGAWMAFLLQLSDVFSAIALRPLRWASYLVLAAYAGGFPVLVGQLQGRFSDEEFFVAIQAGVLSALWLLLRLPFLHACRQSNNLEPPSGLAIKRSYVTVWLVLLGTVLCIITPRSYQNSFYAREAKLYGQITPTAPFLCNNSASTIKEAATRNGIVIFTRLLEAVAANPKKSTPEYGMLALGTGEERWAQAFRESLLREARTREYSRAAHSVKYIQREAALRAYYVPLMQKAFPGLFTDADQHEIREWFAAINRRAWTVEWVDWMYAMALGQWPLGPYENQENGAGLLALLIASNLEDPQVAGTNRTYLEQNPRGWQTRFRNTDDAFSYQLEWITNALFQTQYTGQLEARNRELSFEWMLLQALPDGRAPRYNHPGQPSLAGIAYLAALELNDPRYLWLADQALEVAALTGQNVYAQPGVERPVDFVAVPPDIGSCLIYGDSGLPTQTGPLAPDKIVFRDGWTPDSSYLLLNLRFSGWHRYKATNTVTLLTAQGVPLVHDFLEPQSYWWLPAGRSLLRDKRVPRENLSGLLISERGIRAVLYRLTGIGSNWAQDPPWHADVLDFEYGEELDWSHTRIVNWQGWHHDRFVYFYHNGGPIIVVDRASGPPNSDSTLVWHLFSEAETTTEKAERFPVGDSEHVMEFLMLPIPDDGQPTKEESLDLTSEGEQRIRLAYKPTTPGNLQVISIFLQGEWVGAEIRLVGSTTRPVLSVVRHDRQIEVPLYH